MAFFSLEHGKLAYRADFAAYAATILLVALLLIFNRPASMRWEVVVDIALGLAGWTLIEYALHRFVMHGLQPFRGWHARHHERPRALICTPTLLSAGLILALVFLPALLLGNPWRAGALTFGVLVGYFAYSVTHHAIHHWRSDIAWLNRRKRWHARHHHDDVHPVCFGVTVSLWDRAFATGPHRNP